MREHSLHKTHPNMIYAGNQWGTTSHFRYSSRPLRTQSQPTNRARFHVTKGLGVRGQRHHNRHRDSCTTHADTPVPMIPFPTYRMHPYKPPIVS
jgi:hypothetical protein